MLNNIPSFTSQGILPQGIHTCSGTDFIERFCQATGARKDLQKAFIDVLDFAASRNARFVFVGGSFVTEKEDPDDLDIVIAFRKKEHIPSKSERLVLAGKRTDIMFCSEDEPKILDAFLHLLAHGRFSEQPGVVQVNLFHDGAAWQVHHAPDDDTYEVIKRVYFNRQLIDLNAPSGILVTVHGLMSHADWNSHIVPIASSQGWIVAPYNYGFQKLDILLSTSKRKDAVDTFRQWLFALNQEYGQNGACISVIAHSFGTYLLGAYLYGFEEEPPVTFNTLILTGSILNENYDWAKCAGNKVARVRNEIAPNDQWVKWMPENPGKWTGLDPLFGRAGTKGFSVPADILTQPSNKIFDHNNVIEKDVITSQWMPYLNSNRYAPYDEFIKFSMKKYGKSTAINK
jgi:hypothetical protein